MRSAAAVSFLTIFAVTATAAADDIIRFKRGVEFPHKKHQEMLKDCSACHPGQPAGKIPGFGREWAHKTCRTCHTSRNPRTACHDCHKL